VPKYLVPGLVAALIAWGLYLGIGAAFPEVGPAPADRPAVESAAGQATTLNSASPESGQPQARTDWSNFRPWRGVVVLICSAVFLAWFWGLQRLYVRRHPANSCPEPGPNGHNG
jgi:hypothetical protein